MMLANLVPPQYESTNVWKFQGQTTRAGCTSARPGDLVVVQRCNDLAALRLYTLDALDALDLGCLMRYSVI